MPPLPRTFEASDYTINIVEVAAGLANPWSLAFLPGGDMLVTERAGRLRIVRDGVLDPTPIPGTPQVRTT
ncbi:MAG TPA: PQQ-dependent sugar dehydrogenase, partial [Gammaproteobacteria bacterium]|nr:PQQ-dependent sugar dehydrogenase [Gammaproteobacteria bacterium]